MHMQTQICELSTRSWLVPFTVREQVCLQVFQFNDMKHLSYTITVKLNFVLHFDYKLEEQNISCVLRIRLKKGSVY